MQFNSSVRGLLVLTALSAASGAGAQTQRNGGEAQKFMQQYQQLAAEDTALKGQLADLKKQLESATAQTAAVKKDRDALKAGAGSSTAALQQALNAKSAAEHNLEQSKQRINELVGRFRETLQSLKELESDRNEARKQLAERTAAFDQCARDNVQLYEVSSNVLDRYEHVGLFTKAGASEPFTKITRTRIENLVEEYRIKADALKVKERPPQ
jgi:chromosome segregation ATPase